MKDRKTITRFGIGYDIHRFVPGRPLILGGVKVPFNVGLAGHSDADVLLHAICDALLGAAALGDIGTHFPDTSRKYKNVSSVTLLREVARMIQRRNYAVGNIDATILLEAPKVRPYARRMQKAIARALRVPHDRISIKATTNEMLGSIGRGEGCAALAIASITRPE